MKTVFIIPREGVKIRNHDGRGHVPAEGVMRQLNSYYDRRIKDGDLLVRDEPSKPAAPAPEVLEKTGNTGKSKGDK